MIVKDGQWATETTVFISIVDQDAIQESATNVAILKSVLSNYKKQFPEITSAMLRSDNGSVALLSKKCEM